MCLLINSLESGRTKYETLDRKWDIDIKRKGNFWDIDIKKMRVSQLDTKALAPSLCYSLISQIKTLDIFYICSWPTLPEDAVLPLLLQAAGPWEEIYAKYHGRTAPVAGPVMDASASQIVDFMRALQEAVQNGYCAI